MTSPAATQNAPDLAKSNYLGSKRRVAKYIGGKLPADGKTIFDPMCGVSSVLIEAARKGYRVHASGKDVHAFCRERGINAVAFYKWRKRLGLAPSQREESPATEAKAAAKAATQTAAKLVSVRLTSKTPGGWGIEIQFPAGHVLRIGRGVDADVVTTVLAAMRAMAC
jgi:hypothetical protein